MTDRELLAQALASIAHHESSCHACLETANAIRDHTGSQAINKPPKKIHERVEIEEAVV